MVFILQALRVPRDEARIDIGDIEHIIPLMQWRHLQIQE